MELVMPTFKKLKLTRKAGLRELKEAAVALAQAKQRLRPIRAKKPKKVTGDRSR